MTNVTPAVKRNIVKKRTAKFVRHQKDMFIRLRRSSWRKSHGIDSNFRRRFKGMRPEVKIGYGTKKTHRHVLPCGFKKFPVHNLDDLELLLMHNRTYAAEIATGVSSVNRKAIVERAAQLNVKVLNPSFKIRTIERN
jgi:large subunit ribosomal protein L32e